MKTNNRHDARPQTRDPGNTEEAAGKAGASFLSSGASAPTDAEHRQLVAIVNASRDAIWSWDRDGTIISWNAEAERLFRYTADEIVGQSIFTLVPRERHEIAREALADLRKGDWFGQYETERVAKDGTRVPVELTVSPIRDDSGAPVGAATICRDIGERIEAERARRLLAAIVDSSEDAIVAKDLDGTIQSWNRSAERLFGYTAEEAVGRPITVIIPEDRLEEETQILGRIRRGEHVAPYDTVRQRKDGGLVDISLTVSPVVDGRGRIIGASKIARDITKRKRSEYLRALLTRELNHRVKNTLAIVQALANQTFAEVPEAGDALAAFRGRLGALSAAHDLLIRENWEAAPMGQLVGDVLKGLGDAGRVSHDGPAVTLAAGPAVTVSLALHELATNAVKYGALSSPEGSVALGWTVSDDAPPEVRLVWEERGGPPVAPPERRGFGLRLLERMLSQQNGDVAMDFRPEGLVCTLTVPVTRDSDPAPPRGAGGSATT